VYIVQLKYLLDLSGESEDGRQKSEDRSRKQEAGVWKPDAHRPMPDNNK